MTNLANIKCLYPMEAKHLQKFLNNPRICVNKPTGEVNKYYMLYMQTDVTER